MIRVNSFEQTLSFILQRKLCRNVSCVGSQAHRPLLIHDPSAPPLSPEDGGEGAQSNVMASDDSFHDFLSDQHQAASSPLTFQQEFNNLNVPPRFRQITPPGVQPVSAEQKGML